MKPLTIVTTLSAILVISQQQPLEDLDGFLVYPVETPTSIQKREASPTNKNKNNFKEFIEEKLIEHTQALELLVKKAQNHEEIEKLLLENLSQKLEPPKMPEKVEPNFANRRSNVDNEFMLRRSLDEEPEVVTSIPNQNENSPWCSVAMLCPRSYQPICGYDENFGYGKFDGICHLFQVNCHWKYNFSIAPGCKPMLRNSNNHVDTNNFGGNI